MATLSFTKNIRVKKSKNCETLVRSLENAEKKKEPSVRMSRSVSDATQEDIRLLFGDNEE